MTTCFVPTDQFYHEVTQAADPGEAFARRFVEPWRPMLDMFSDHWANKLDLPRFGMPTYGGYAAGIKVVQEYTRRTGASVLKCHEPWC